MITLNSRGPVYLVDDEPALLKALSRLLKAEGFMVKAFGSALDFLGSSVASGPGCVVVDEAMPGMTGSELQHSLQNLRSSLAVVFLTGNGDIPMSVRAIKRGAVDFLTKPVKDEELIAAIRAGLKKTGEMVVERSEIKVLEERHALLTGREREVMLEVVRGLPNKQIAGKLEIVEQTVKVHRSRVMHKMGAESLADLVLFAEKLGIAGNRSPKA
jgi:FixJ family two-component response regulator